MPRKRFALYAARHPEVTRNFRVYNDSDIPKNNMYFQVANGVVKHTNQPLPDTEALTISELADFILADRRNGDEPHAQLISPVGLVSFFI